LQPATDRRVELLDDAVKLGVDIGPHDLLRIGTKWTARQRDVRSRPMRVWLIVYLVVGVWAFQPGFPAPIAHSDLWPRSQWALGTATSGPTATATHAARRVHPLLPRSHAPLGLWGMCRENAAVPESWETAVP
jgi:hypothetical protein